MATDKPRFTITLEPETLSQVLEYKDANHIVTQSGAIQRLVELGIKDLIGTGRLTTTKKAPSLSDEAMQIAVAYDRADSRAKQVVDLTLEPFMEKKAKSKIG